MAILTFGDYIRKRREDLGLPLRKVAAHLDIDTSTLSKVERGERPASASYLKPLSEILQLDLKIIQMTYIVDEVLKNFGKLEHLSEGLNEVRKQLKARRNNVV